MKNCLELILAGLLALLTLSLPYDGAFPQHKPMGTGIGAMPGRVV